ncbi:MAG: cell division protein FtsW [Lachnospiraceae bacterium]|nr:cell division protein FtsW [Lachnospiraceae bacterium]MBQ9233284.1 cell division protein FtsW [Lachnospiraceae bacterium]
MEKSRRTTKNSFWVKGGYIDYQTIFLTFVIVLFGLMMVYSASSYRAITNGYAGTYFMIRQGVFAVIGFIGMYAISRINYRYLSNLSVILMYIAIAMLVFVLILGRASHGATRWIQIGPLQLQPSEIAKPIIIIYMSDACVKKSKYLNTMTGIFKIVWLPVVCIGLIAVENLSTAIVCFAIVVAILFVASPKIFNLVILGIIGIIAAWILIKTVGYRGDRFEAWRNPEASEKGFQTLQSLYAIGSGGFFGRGLGNSIQKLGFLPESHNDMIFSVVCEELGLFGALVVIALFVMLIFRFKFIADSSIDSFGGFIITGVITHLAVQLIVNIGVVTNTIPPTGVTLPFISYGGTSLIFMMAEVGLVLSVSRQMSLTD